MSNTRYEIIIQLPDTGENRYLDTYKYEPVNLTFNVADVQDISKRNSSFSRTITLPETKNNRDVFNNISDLASDSTFDPNKKAKAQILVDTVVVFDGYLQLKSVTTTNNLENKYEVVIFADNDTFFTRLGSSYIENLDFNDLNHVYSTASIINSWNSGQELGYYYPLIDYGQGWTIDMIDGIQAGSSYSTLSNAFVNVNDMFPAVYVKTIVDKIFAGVGFTYKSNFFNSQVFKNLLIPFNGESINAGFTPSNNLSTFFVGAYGNQVAYDPSGVDILYFPDAVFPFNNSNGLMSSSGLSGGLDTFTNPYVTNQKFVLYLDITTGAGSGSSIGIPVNCRIKIIRQKNPLNGVVDPNWATGGDSSNQYYELLNISLGAITIFWGQTSAGTIQGTGLSYEAELYDYQVGQYYSYRIKLFSSYLMTYYDNDPDYLLGIGEEVRVLIVNGGAGTVAYEQLGGLRINAGSYFMNEISPSILAGGLVEYNYNVPKKVKQSDFITSLVKMFNLYIEPSKEKDNELIIEPREDYYAQGTIKDWTSKIDLNEPITQQILADTQSRQLIFTYKDDKDRYNTLYKSSFNQIYGQYIYDTESEFAKGEKKIETIFSPTPLGNVPGSINFVIPRIVKDDLNYNALPGSRIDSNIRIVTRNENGLINFDNQLDKWGFEGEIYTTYPYVGHFDNPYSSSYDINFGSLIKAYYVTTFYTNNNLVERYWMPFLEETLDKDSRLITVSMYLSPVDINNFKFNDTIYLFFNGNGHYYKVNKIDGYDPGSIKTCKVELIKSLSKPVYTKARNVTTPKPDPQTDLTAWSTNVVSLKPGNTVISGGAVVTGKDNYIRSNDIMVNGTSNFIDSRKGYSQIINGQANGVIYKNDNILLNGDLNQLKISQIFGTCCGLIPGYAYSPDEPYVQIGICDVDEGQNKIYVFAEAGATCSPWPGCTAYNYAINNNLTISVYNFGGDFLGTVSIIGSESTACSFTGTTIKYEGDASIGLGYYFTYPNPECNQYWRLFGDWDCIEGKLTTISCTGSEAITGTVSLSTPYDPESNYTTIQLINPSTGQPYGCLDLCQQTYTIGYEPHCPQIGEIECGTGIMELNNMTPVLSPEIYQQLADTAGTVRLYNSGNFLQGSLDITGYSTSSNTLSFTVPVNCNTITSDVCYVEFDLNCPCTIFVECNELIAASASNRIILISGEDNRIAGSNSNVSISGNKNYVGTGSNTLSVFGHENTVGEKVSNVNVFGNNNTVADGLTGVYVVGDNQSVTTSNQVYISSPMTFNGNIDMGENYIYSSGTFNSGVGDNFLLLDDGFTNSIRLRADKSAGSDIIINANNDIYIDAGNSISISAANDIQFLSETTTIGFSERINSQPILPVSVGASVNIGFINMASAFFSAKLKYIMWEAATGKWRAAETVFIFQQTGTPITGPLDFQDIYFIDNPGTPLVSTVNVNALALAAGILAFELTNVDTNQLNIKYSLSITGD